MWRDMNRKKIAWLVALLVLCAIGGGAYVYWQQKQTKTPYRFANIERGGVVATVSATGTLNPVVSVQVGSQVSGQIKEILVDYNSEVKRGQVIARIDPESFMLRVGQAQADLEAARATLLTQRANVAALQAEVSRVQVALLEAQRDFNRNQLLVEKNFVTQAVLEKSHSAVAIAQEQVKTAQAQRAVGDAQVSNGVALVQQRESQLAQARVDLERTTIRAPVNGIVISKSVDAGQTVAASLQAPILFLIARNLADMQVEASIDESEIGRIRIGQEASFTVDSFPGRTFRGTITQVRKAPLVAQNVVTYVAIISAPNPELILLPGMTTNVRITVAQREQVLRIPSAALRYRPPGTATPGKGQRDGARNPEQKEGAARSEGKSGGKAGEGGQAMRERLTQELSLDAAQQAKLETIQRATSDKIAAIQTDDPVKRKKEIGQIRAQSRADIAAILNPAQRERYAAMGAEQRGVAVSRGTVWVVDEKGLPKSIPVRLGISDGTMIELIAGEIKEGDAVIVGGGSAGADASSPPRFGF